MDTPSPLLLTVISNVHNDADRLPRAVRSALAGWEGPGIEVLVVDDGSTDATGAVADALAADDDRVRVLHRGENDGAPGAPRNLGLDAARGEWVAFVDSDDEYLPGSLRRLVDAAREADADVAAGAVARYNERTDRVSPLPATDYVAGPVDPLEPGSPLWQDTIAVAKVIRRSLLDDRGIRFPERILYEDQPFTVALWSSARRIATLDEVVYHWYVNNVAGEESITARRHEVENFHDRIAANRAIDAQLADRPDLAAAKLDKFVRHDLALYGKDLDARDTDYRAAFLGAARDYLREQPVELRAALAQPYRLVVRELVDGEPESAVAAALFAYRRKHLERPLAHRSGRWWWPYRSEDAGADHDLTLLVEKEHAKGRQLRTTTATAVRVERDALRLEGAVVDGDDSLGARSRLTMVLVERDSGSTLASATTRVRHHGRFDVRLDLPSPDADAPPAKAWDVKVTFPSTLARLLPRRAGKPSPVEVPAALELPPLDGGLELYRTRNGNLSVRPVADDVDDD
ncbi:glycosyltransferase family 2 protein [Terrabacter sp. MAHUQ-38]|uniref:glycosyltransferase family 2 protein n=1 Tax=unclassified Terrabacter TaxID=2630222 RepID=UPI00165E8E84|nr:glycosyltransferase family 2 protein [Terrabacter sp. MAHUQ-38]